MVNVEADRNLLFGILALQMDFITRDALIVAMNAWVLEKQTPLGRILKKQGALSESRHALLEVLVNEHVRQHDGDPKKSLESVSSLGSTRRELEAVSDPDLQATLAHVPEARKTEADATTSMQVGQSTSTGARFRILRPHARGGLGEVFVAYDSELNREVALKEIQADQAHNTASRSRFLLEAEVTGGLEHPNIVPVYGLGTYADGRPYYAMRFIRGDSLKEAIERFHAADKAPGRDPGERSIAMRKLLGRFIDVCNAIAYAHSRGVLHRDLKPGNIMLGKYGETLVVDWGLAKPVDQPEASTTEGEAVLRPSSGSGLLGTVAGKAIGTPSFMSPEQARGDLDRIGPASDVYSLGATLYTLLTGKTPFEERSIGDLLRRIERGEFPPPRSLAPDVPRALEATCLKAMAVMPEDRYAGPRALADDIEHWLADEPVSAYREGWSERLARWSRRHRTWVRGAAAAVAVGLIAAVALAIQQSRAADRERRIADRERTANQLAQSRLVQVEKGSDLLASIFRDIDPRQEDQQGKPLRALLGDRIDKVVGQLEGESVSDPLTVAKLQTRLGAAQLNLGNFGRAIPLYNSALQTREGKLGHDHPDTLEVRSGLAEAYRFDGRVSEAIALEQETLKMRLAKLGPDHADTLSSQNQLAEAYRAAGRFADAIPLHEDTLKRRAATLGPDHLETLATRSNLGNAYTAANRLADAIKLHEETLRLSEAKLGADHIDTIVSRINLAAAYRIAGRTAEAMAMHEGTLKLASAKLGADHHITLVTRINLATAYRVSGRAEEAIAMNEETLKLSSAKLGPDQPETLSTRHNLAESYRVAGRIADAIAMHEETLKLRATKLGAGHPDTLQSRNNLAESYESLGRWADAEPLRREIITQRRKTSPGGSPILARDLAGLGRTLLHLEKWSEAESLVRESLTFLDKGQPDDWFRLHAMSLLGGVLAGQGRYTEAEPLIVAGYEGLKARAAKIPRTAPPFLTEAGDRVLQFYEAAGKPEQAAAWKVKLGKANIPSNVFVRP
jgi:serine/threonine protein kinase/tetratricopeptide (TPR) repeat protein